MYKFSTKAQKWLKAVHIFFASLWVGAAVSITAMIFVLKANHGMQLYGINQAINFIDVYIIIPGNTGIVLTGILYSSFTNWGWFKQPWITVKWIIAIYGMLFGIIWLGPWAESLEHISRLEGMNALNNETYNQTLVNLYWWGTFQAATIVFASFISSLKPWRRKRKKESLNV